MDVHGLVGVLFVCTDSPATSTIIANLIQAARSIGGKLIVKEKCEGDDG